jgi:hypothetical protein
MTARTVDTLPIPDRLGVQWTWSLDNGAYRGVCLVQPFLVEVRVERDAAAPLAMHDDYTLSVIVKFNGYELQRGRYGMPVPLRQLTPDAVLNAVEERAMLSDAVEAARSMVTRIAEMMAEGGRRVGVAPPRHPECWPSRRLAKA